MVTKQQNPLQQLADAGQAFWYDNIRRQFLQDGTLKKLVDEDGLRGVTANPTIFEQALSAGTDYDIDIKALVEQGADATAIYERLITDDVRSACDILRPVYDATNGQDGYISLEVSPLLARNTAGTIKEVKRFWGIVDRPNLMVKIPATREGLPAIEQSLTDGININITLIFAVERYIDVARAYVRALRLRAQRGEPVERMASVASFFVSRVDSKVDKQLDEKIARAKSADDKQELESLKGKAAIANARVAYEEFKQIFYGQDFADLKAKGARVQRPLWASTSTKNPAYRDVMYVEELIGPDTVDTMPPKTIDAFRDHGKVKNTLDEGVAEAHQLLERLARAGIIMDAVTRELEEEGVASFATSFETLADQINAKRDALLAHFERSESASLGRLQARVDEAMADAAENQVAARLQAKDATLWKPKTKKDDPEISGWLGWLAAPEVGLQALDDLETFVGQVRADGFTDAVVLGMGGSSLAPEVFKQTFGTRAGYPRLHVLDSTDPANVLGIESELDLAHTLFMVSSKSGGTTEPNTFFAYFWDKVQQSGVREPGKQFVAITDKGSSLEKLGKEHGFRRVFLNDPTIGGRYSALSFFGLLPAALAGVELRPLLERARAMGAACGAEFAPAQNPGIWLGTIMGEAAKSGRDKVTLLCSPSLDSFGLWAEQLLAESTGKEGKGLIPIAGEEIGLPGVYGDDRLFVYLHVQSDGRHALDKAVTALEDAGQPVVRLELGETLDLGAEFMRWEFATAVAGAVLGINPFDQPNVQESKDNTKRLLAEFQQKGRLPEPEAIATAGGISLVGGTSGTGASGRNGASEKNLAQAVQAFLKDVKPGDYVAIMAYLPYDESIERELQDHRLRLRNALKVATTLGYGPRFLHSTGQLHKGGPNSGVFIQLTHTSELDVPVPGKEYSFAVLEAAQALGDLQSLQKHGRRAIGLHVDSDVRAALEVVVAALPAVGSRQ
ncbi:MAG: bifunctional transaldolase/phosoglucose isomerase [Dehalococcoidia bacterium]